MLSTNRKWPPAQAKTILVHTRTVYVYFVTQRREPTKCAIKTVHDRYITGINTQRSK